MTTIKQTLNRILFLWLLTFCILKVNAQVPTVIGFSPISGNAGTIVTITGTNFSTIPANNTVYFGATKATVVNASATSLQVTTPLGATYAPVTVINTFTGLIAVSSYYFTPTFSGGTPGFKYRQTIEDDYGYKGQASADFDGDGKADLSMIAPSVFASAATGIRSNNSSNAILNIGNYSPIIGATALFGLEEVQGYADFNGDGKRDVYRTSLSSNFGGPTYVSFAKNTTSGVGAISFSAFQDIFFENSIPGRLYDATIFAADFDLDGKIDLLAYNPHFNKVSFYKNTSTFSTISFASKQEFTFSNTNGFLMGIMTIADVNGDNKTDVVVGSIINGSDIEILLNTTTTVGSISFSSPHSINLGFGGYLADFKFADVNSDGTPDILATVFNDHLQSTSFIPNLSSIGTLAFGTKVDFGPTQKMDHIEVADINGDGKLDYLTSYQKDSVVYVFTNVSSGATINFSYTPYRIKTQNNWYSCSLSIGDLDNDGKPDIVTGRSDFNNSSYNYTTNSFPHATSVLFNGYAPPTVTVTGSIDTFSVCNNISSSTQAFTVTSTYLPANMVISVPTNLEVSLAPNSGFGSIVTIVPIAGAIATTTIYVRASAVNSAGLSTFTGSINVSSDAIVPVPIPAVVMYNAGNWNGQTNNDFNNATNWTGCYPAANINITIPNLVTSPLLTQVGTIRDLTINAGANLEITGKLQIGGTALNNGILDVDNGAIELNALIGTGSISALNPLAGKIHQLIVNQTTVSMNAKLYLDSLTLTQGTLYNGDSLNIAQAITRNIGTIDCSNSATNAIIFNGTTIQTIPINSFINKTLQHLVISNKVGVNATGNLTVNGKLTLNGGVLITNNDTIIFPASASAISINNGYVDGNVRKTGNLGFTFPVGNGGKYAPISIGLSASSSDQFTASYTNANPNSLYSTSSLGTGLNRVSQAEYWLLKRTGGSNTQTVTLSWDTSRSVAIGLATDVRVAGWDGTKWVNQGNTATTGNLASGTVKSNVGINTFGAFTLGSSVAASSNADLFSLTINGQSPSPTFNANTLNYTSLQSNSTTIASIVPTPSNASALVYIDGVYLSNGYIFTPLNVGDNTYSIKVVAGDGVTTKTYTLVITRVPLSNADLTNLVVSSGTLIPAFAFSTINYVDTVITTVSSITLIPTALNSTSPSNIKVNGVAVNSGSASGGISLNFGNNTINTVVTSIDGTSTKTYSVNVFRKADNNCNLSALVVNAATISPVFATATTSYSVSVANTTTSVTIKPTTSVTTSTVKVNGVSVTSGNSSGTIPLSVGTNIITTVVTAQDGTTTKTYIVTITRVGGLNANLSALSLSNGTLSPSFTTNTISYTASVANNVTSINITPTLSDIDGSLKVNNVLSPSGTAYGPINLNVGVNTITIVATASNGTTTKTYTVTVTRATSANNNLSNLILSAASITPSFVNTTTSYTASVPYSTTSTTVTPTVEDATATVKVNNVSVASGSASGTINLSYGSNTITIVVTAQSNATKTYTVTVIRLGSSNADLAALVINNGTLTPAFASNSTNYQDTVANSVTSISIRPTATDVGTTIKVNGVNVNSGFNSNSISLAVGNNTINVVTTSGDGSTNKTYTINVYRYPSSNANLLALSLFSGTLSPAFASATASYTATVSANTTINRVIPTVADVTSTITVNGIAVTSGTASGIINLNYGANTVTVVVTAQDGTTKTYTIVITRSCAVTTSTTNVSICINALPYNWNSNNYSSAGSYIVHFTNAAGCDSAATLNLTINNTTSSSTQTASVCSSQLPYSWNGLIFNAAGTQTKTGLINARGCDSSATLTLSISSGSSASINISTVSNNVCAGTLVTFTATPVNGGTAPGYQWKLNGNNVGTNSNTYISTSLASGDKIWCILTSNSACAINATANSNVVTMTVNANPGIGVSSGGVVCGIGGTLSVYNTNTLNGGVWTSSNTSVATVSTASNGAGGLAVGISKGTTILTYTKTNSNGCSVSASSIVTVVNPIITGSSTICRGNTAQLSVSETGGYWASNNNKASVNSTGLVTGVNAGVASINYVVSGCLSTNTFTPTIVAPPAIPGISLGAGSINPQLGATPSSAYCNNKTFTVIGTPAGGVWSSTNPSVVTVTSGGVASTQSVGSGSLVYTVTNASGCSNNRSIVGTVVGCAPRGVNTVDGQQLVVSSDFTMYPNPAKSVININVETLIGKGSIVVTDLYGKTLKAQPLSMGTNTVDIANLSKGMYFVSTITNEGKTTKKLIVE